MATQGSVADQATEGVSKQVPERGNNDEEMEASETPHRPQEPDDIVSILKQITGNSQSESESADDWADTTVAEKSKQQGATTSSKVRNNDEWCPICEEDGHNVEDCPHNRRGHTPVVRDIR
jgi:hypothetical protein